MCVPVLPFLATAAATAVVSKALTPKYSTPAVTAAPSISNTDVQAAAEAQRKKAALAVGMDKTIATGGQGDTTQANIKKTKLGGGGSGVATLGGV